MLRLVKFYSLKGFATRHASIQPVQLQRLAGILKFCMQQVKHLDFQENEHLTCLSD